MGGVCCACEEEETTVSVDHTAVKNNWGNAEDEAYPSTDTMYGLRSGVGSSPEAADSQKMKKLVETPQARRICVTVNRDSLDEKLGIDVKHVCRKLVVVGINTGGAVHRSNERSRNGGGDALEVGDVITQINDTYGNDNAMVSECSTQCVLVIQAERKSG